MFALECSPEKQKPCLHSAWHNAATERYPLLLSTPHFCFIKSCGSKNNLFPSGTSECRFKSDSTSECSRFLQSLLGHLLAVLNKKMAGGGSGIPKYESKQ